MPWHIPGNQNAGQGAYGRQGYPQRRQAAYGMFGGQRQNRQAAPQQPPQQQIPQQMPPPQTQQQIPPQMQQQAAQRQPPQQAMPQPPRQPAQRPVAQPPAQAPQERKPYYDPNVTFEEATPEALRKLGMGGGIASGGQSAAPAVPSIQSPAFAILQNERNGAAFYSQARARWPEDAAFDALSESSGRRLAALVAMFPNLQPEERRVALPDTAREGLKFAIGEEGASIADLAEYLETAKADEQARLSALMYRKIADLARLVAAV